MDVMDGQYFSLAFRERLSQVQRPDLGVSLAAGRTVRAADGRVHAEERQAGVRATVARFWQMLEDAPENMPRLMPMTAAVAPTFCRALPGDRRSSSTTCT
jgi:hypothetical protein